MKIAAKTAVSLDYSLHLGDGVIIDRSDAGEPLTYLHGQGQIVAGLERELEGLEVGAQKRVVVAPKDGYGERHEGRQQKVPLDAFNGETPTVGDEFYAAGPDGMPMPVQVVAVQGKEVTIDLNHPLAGKTLHFSIEVKAVRAATDEELEHGHVHGPDGHGHHDDDEHGCDHDHEGCDHDHSHDEGACGHDHSGSHDPKTCGHDHSHDDCDHHHH